MCVASSIDLRHSSWTTSGERGLQIKTILKTKQLLVGSATIIVGSSCPYDTSDYVLSYKSKVIACGLRGLYGEPAFVVGRRLTNGDNEAALLVSHDGGEMNCSHYYIPLYRGAWRRNRSKIWSKLSCAQRRSGACGMRHLKERSENFCLSLKVVVALLGPGRGSSFFERRAPRPPANVFNGTGKRDFLERPSHMRPKAGKA